MADDTGQTGDQERQKRLARLLGGAEAGPEAILYQHSILCQTGLPYRNPGDDVRSWERRNGAAGLQVNAGSAWHPEKGFVQLGLPYGPKPRLILAHLNTEALRRRSDAIEVEASLTAFVKRLGLDPKGRNTGIIKDQLARLSASSVRLGITHEGGAITVNSQIVTAFNLWFPKEEGGRVLWPNLLRLSPEYFDSLTRHAVPLHDRALMALSGSAMGLDLYAWLAQRLHRIEWGQRVLVPWTALQAQFGWHYDRTRKFREVFRQTLRLVHGQYRAADVELDGRGIVLRHSPPPVKGRTGIVVQVP